MKNNQHNFPTLSLVGAGPGDPELITLKGIETIRNADVIIFDASVNTEFLDYAAFDVPRLFVGKRRGKQAYTQEQINSLIVDSAFTYGHVVRITGGDPLVSGNGKEELNYAALFNIDTTVIPGIAKAAEKIPGIDARSFPAADQKYLLN